MNDEFREMWKFNVSEGNKEKELRTAGLRS
jgi:hypothetical protein